MIYALRQLDNGVYTIINLTENKVVKTFKYNVNISFIRNKKKSYIQLYKNDKDADITLYLLPLDDLIKIEKIENNTVISKDLTDIKNKILSISNFLKSSFGISYTSNNISEQISTNTPTPYLPMVRTMSLPNASERVYIPGTLKIDNNSQSFEEVDTSDDMVLIKTKDSVKSLTFTDFIKVLMTVDSKEKTIWDLGQTSDVDESEFGTNPNWELK